MTKIEAMKIALATELKIKDMAVFDEKLEQLAALVLERKELGLKIVQWESTEEGLANEELASLARIKYKELTEKITIKIKYINTLLATY